MAKLIAVKRALPGWELLPGWKRLLLRAYSVRFAIVAALCSAAEVALPVFTDRFSPGVFAVLAAAAAVGGVLARVVAQPKTLPREAKEAEEGAERA